MHKTLTVRRRTRRDQSAGASTIVDYFFNNGTQLLTASYDFTGVTASAPGGQLERTSSGLGLVGGFGDYYIDRAESVRFNFDAGSATAVSFEADSIANLDTSKARPAASVTLYSVGGAVQGSYAFLPFTQPNFITTLSNFYAGPISGFSVTGNQTALAIAKITYTAQVSAAPEPRACCFSAPA